MKTYLSLLVLLILAAFGAGYYGFSFRGDYQASPKDKVDISYHKRNFVKVHTPSYLINTRDLFPSKDFKLLAFAPRDKNIKNPTSFYSKVDCFKEISNLSSNRSVQKVLIWENYRCNKDSRLPGSFFQFAPFVHPSGYSYVYLFFKFKGTENVSTSWLLKHLKYLTYNELSELVKKYKEFPQPYKFLSTLNKKSYPQLASLTGTFFSGEYVFLLDWDIFNFFETIYKVYPKKEFVDFFESTPYSASTIGSRRCLIKEGNLCWNYSFSHLIEKVGYSNLTISFILIACIVFGLFAIYSIFSKEKKEDEKRKFALRILSHELRTPVSAMLLKLESLSKSAANFSDEDQEKVLKISSDAHRLRRLIEMSTNYLTSSQDKSQKIKKELDSVNGFIESFTFEYQDLVVKYLDDDLKIETDEYWLQVCVKNLIENALLHGNAPVRLECKTDDKFLKISVSDAGECSFDNLKQMSQDFVKGNKSTGTGLGLNIVQNVLKKLNGKLQFSKNPTTFTILLEKGAI